MDLAAVVLLVVLVAVATVHVVVLWRGLRALREEVTWIRVELEVLVEREEPR